MALALVWIEILLLSLLWVAMMDACISHLSRWAARFFLLLLALAGPLLYLGPITALTGFAKFQIESPFSHFNAAVSLLCAYLVGFAVIIFHGGRRIGVDRRRRASTWSRWRLAVAFLVALTVANATLWRMDVAARANVLAYSRKAIVMMQSVAPAPVPDIKNAAPIYELAFARIKADPLLQKSKIQALFDEHPNLDSAEAVDCLTRHAITLKLLRQAARIRGCYFDRDYADSNILMALPQLSSFKTAARLLNLDAKFQLSRGNVDGAIDDEFCMVAMARHIGQEPIIVSVLVSIGVRASALQTLEEILPHVTEARQLDALPTNDLEIAKDMLNRALVGEESGAMGSFSRMAMGNMTLDSQMAPGAPTLSRQPAMMLYRVFCFGDEIRDYLTCMEEYQHLWKDDFFPTDANLATAAQNSTIQQKPGGWTRLLTPRLWPCFATAAQSDASAGEAELAVAMTRYRLDRGSYPASLAELVPGYLKAIPTDPFNGQSLHMTHRSDGGCIVYSVGPDGTDDGGAEFDRKTRKGDIIFTLELQPTTHPSEPRTK